MDVLAQYKKFIAALVTAIVVGLFAFVGIGDGETVFGVDIDKVAAFVATIIGAVFVRQVKNEPPQ